jgi:hypothetical protein
MSDQTVPSPTLNPQAEQIRQMIAVTTVLNEVEKKYWLDLLPTMNEGQLTQLKAILESEQKNMQAIDQKYDKKLEDVAQKYLSRWDSEKNKAARNVREMEEQKHREEEQAKAEELLGRW